MRIILVVLIGLVICIDSIQSQIIDSILIKPYPNVDSIQFWHTKESRISNQFYFVKGYFEYCSCDYHRFLNEHNYKGKEKIIICEGMLKDDLKNGTWTYWEDVKGQCCDEILLDSDSTVTYDYGKRIKKIDRFATYSFYGSDSLSINPFYNDKEVIKNKIICQKELCKIIVNDKYVLKMFSIENIDTEIEKLNLRVYNLESRKLIEESNKR